MMLDTPTSAHPLPTPPGSPTSLATATSSSSGTTTGQLCRGVRAEMAQQANEVCQLVAKANQAPNGLQAEELRRLLSDIHTLQVLAQQLHPTAGSTSSAPSSPSSSPSPSPSPPHSPPGLSSLASWGAPRSKISKKKPAHHTAALSRPLSTSSPSPAAACGRSCMPPIRPRLPPSAPGAGSTSTTTTTSTTPSSASPSETLMPTSSTSATITITNGVRACANCGTTNTVQWRCGADGKPSLCNACGLRYRYNLKKKALYEDIACVRALSLQRSANASPPYPHLPLSPTGSLPRASPALTAPAATMAATTPTRQPRPMAITSASTPTAATGSMAIAEPPVRRSNIYSLLN